MTVVLTAQCRIQCQMSFSSFYEYYRCKYFRQITMENTFVWRSCWNVRCAYSTQQSKQLLHPILMAFPLHGIRRRSRRRNCMMRISSTIHTGEQCYLRAHPKPRRPGSQHTSMTMAVANVPSDPLMVVELNKE